MKCVVILTKVEELTLQHLSINHPYADMRVRAVGLLMLAGGKFRPAAIGERLGVSAQSVYNWAHIWRGQGIPGLLLRVGHKGGRPRVLSEEMVASAVDIASTRR